MNLHAIQQQGYQLLHDGAIELAHVEANGIRIDVRKLAETKQMLQDKMRQLRKEMEATDVWKAWRKRFGEKANLTSRPQLGTILHVDLKYEVNETTETGRPVMDEEALSEIDNPFVAKIVRYLKYDKAVGTFLNGIQREVIGNRLHPSFLLHTVRSFRSSSSEPNFQNFPVRDKEISELIRSQFIASKGHVLVENDFKGAEVVVSAAYHKDKNFISYITDPTKDMHRDMAAQIYKLKPSEVSKETRYGAKNKFVFPQFYGDYYVACAQNLWDWIRKGKLTTPDGVSLYKHLKQKGIDRLGACDPDEDPEEGTFEAHLKKVENDFWNRRFMAYGKWRKDWYNAYLDKGYFDLKTGFRVYGSFGRNAVTNYPIQGSAFHCLLWSLIRINRLLRKYKMRSMIVGQIHDSLLGDVHVDELADYLCIVEEVVEEKLRKAYDWLVVPLQIEYEIAPEGGSWFEKRECHFKRGRFLHPEDKEASTTCPQAFLRALKDNKRNG
jgi:DNA polymerase I-like protein with 3'-5' exonuclease and polymerase domains